MDSTFRKSRSLFFLSFRFFPSIPLSSSSSWSRALHQFQFGAFRTDNVIAIGNKTTSDQRGFAARTDETVIMPVSILEWDETSAADTYINRVALRLGQFQVLTLMHNEYKT